MASKETGGSSPADDVFVEQAEYIDPSSFLEWTTAHPNEKQILQKLSRGGAKLLVGPRGCGKTTLLLKAFHILSGQKTGRTLPVYVNFKASLRLEPLYKRQANAMYWFNQWMLFKTYAGLLDTLAKLKVPAPPELKFTRDEAVRITQRMEMNADLGARGDSQELTVEELSADVDRALEATDRSRCVLFLDDAAHAFSPDQQRDFFDFFRRIKSQRLAPKAAIYPGVTILSPTFHIGHDAEEIDVWLDPYEDRYLQFMRDLLRQRLPSEVVDVLASEPALLDLVCFAAFGMPRALLNIVRGFYEEDEDSDGDVAHKISFTSTNVLRAIRSAYGSTLGGLRLASREASHVRELRDCWREAPCWNALGRQELQQVQGRESPERGDRHRLTTARSRTSTRLSTIRWPGSF